MSKFPRFNDCVYIEPSVINGNVDIYATLDDGTKSVLTVNVNDLHGALNAFKFLGYTIMPNYNDYIEQEEYR